MTRPVVLVTGGRDFRDADLVDRVLSRVSPGLLIEGGADGADKLCGMWAREKGIHAMRVDARWGTFGNRAGPIRNSAMVRIAVLLKAGGTEVVCVAFPGGAGTANCVGQARAAGLNVIDAAALDHPATRALLDAFGAAVETVEPDTSGAA